jgi:DNA-binding Lrp family transcriptional regulator
MPLIQRSLMAATLMCPDKSVDLDTHDTRILAELQADARLTMAELGRRAHLSQPAVTEGIRKLEASGVASGYRATVNLVKLGCGIRAIIRIGPTTRRSSSWCSRRPNASMPTTGPATTAGCLRSQSST